MTYFMFPVLFSQVLENPFAHGYIPSEKAHTVRDVQPELYKTDKDGKHSNLFNLVLEVLEQTDYCDFEVTLKIKNTIFNLKSSTAQ